MKRLYLLASFAASLFFHSCKKDKIDNPALEVPIATAAFAIKDIDLNERSNWILSGGGLPYSFTIIADTLHAVPVGEPFRLSYEPSPYSFNYIGFQLISPTYHKIPHAHLQRNVYATSPVSEIFPDITDQSDALKFMNADALTAINFQTPTSAIKDGKFIHRNTLIDFETVNVPNDAVVRVLQSEETKPYNYKPGFHKAIVVAVPAISVKIGADVYTALVTDPKGMTANTHYTFKVVYDDARKTLSIADLSSKTWSATD